MINNRQNGRRRGRGGGGNGQRNGSPGNPNSGNRIDNRARGNANQLYEKYKNLARDAQMSGDRVNTEYYLQFADHYFRVLSESRSRFEEQNPNAPQQRRIQPVDSFDDFDDGDDYADEGEPIRAGEQDLRGPADYQQGGQQAGQQGQRHNGQRDPGPRAQRDDAPRGQREQGGRDDAARYETRRPAYEGDRGTVDPDRYAGGGAPVANDLNGDGPDRADPSPVEARRRGRPRRVESDAEGAAPALDADRLPPSLSSGAATDGDDTPRPRRRRVRANGEASTLG